MSRPRRSPEYQPAVQQRLLLGLDVGGTKISGIAVDQSDKICARVLLPTDVGSGSADERRSGDKNLPGAVASIFAAIRELLISARAGREDILAIGLGIPGQVQGGQVRLAVNLKLESFPLAETLQAAFGAPVILENDVRTAAVGLYRYFHQRCPVENMAYLSIGTGVSAGLVQQGRLYRGTNGMAGEIGHIGVAPGGPRCSCGGFGCLEALIAGPAIARLAGQAVQSGQDTRLSEFHPLNAQAVFESAAAGDAAAQAIVKEVCETLSRAVQGLIMAYDVDLLALGGGVFRAGERLLAPLKEELGKLRAQSALANEMLSGDKIKLAPSGFDAGAWGAITLACHTLRQSNPSTADDFSLEGLQ